MLKTYDTCSGGSVTLNLGEDFAILDVPSRRHLEALHREFRKRQWEWLHDLFTSPAKDRAYLFGTVGSVMNVRNKKGEQTGQIVFNTVRIATSDVPDAWFDELGTAKETHHVGRNMRLVGAPVDAQAAFLGRLLGKGYDRSAARWIRPDLHDVYVYGELDDLVIGGDVEASIRSVIDRASFERRDLPRSERKSAFLRRFLPDAWLMWMAHNGVLLHPVRVSVMPGESNGIEKHLVGPEQESVLAVYYGRVSDIAQRNSPHWRGVMRKAADNLFLSSTFRGPADIANEMFSDLYGLLDRRMDPRVADALVDLHRSIRDGLARPETVAPFKPRRGAKRSENPFAWIGRPMSASNVKPFPRFLIGPYQPRDHLVGWGERIWSLLAKSNLKNIGNLVHAAQHFLVWLANHPRPIRSVDDVTREDINGAGTSSNDLSFRSYLKRHSMVDETANSVLMRVSWIFDHLIEEDGLVRPNPINLRFDGFKGRPTRGKTPRSALDREMLGFLREVNARDDFALSRTYTPHGRRLLDPTTGRYDTIWFPAFAVIIDLLLQLPLRSFQARFLDSGEGDEMTFDPLSETPSPAPNKVSNATPRRRESAFCLFENTKGDRSVGLYVNTNKTSVDRDGGYEIPWTSPDIRKNLFMMAEWQRIHNPVAAPIPTMERKDVEQSRNAELVETAKTTYALFRDPDDPNGWPVSRDKLFDYWCRLLAAAEDELAAIGRPVMLTTEIEVPKGPGKRPVKRRHALYDIHTLRVSGITSLIEAGLPPDLVQEVAGHAVLVMTLYYNKIKASKLNQRLADAIEKLGPDLDRLRDPSDMPIDLPGGFVNRRSPEDAVGASMLADRIGHEAGGFEVMTHGICPGGECSTGGEFTNQAVGYGPVPRPLACPLCRYRLTGPMFLPGLVLNANRLMHELRRKAEEIAALNEEKSRLADAGRPVHGVKARIEGLYRETDVIAAEWAAEVQYVHQVEGMFGAGEEGSTTGQAVVTGLEGDHVQARLGEGSGFGLLQSLAEGAQIWPGFKPRIVLEDHREFLNEILSMSGLDPFLLRMKGEVRDRAAVMLGRAIMASIPEERINDARRGEIGVGEYPAIAEFLALVRSGEIERPTVAMAALTESTWDEGE